MSVAVKTQPDLFDVPKGAPPSGNSIVLPPFWLVICTEAIEDERGRQMLTRGYKFIHDDEASAESEATRLAGKFKDFEFAIVKSVAIIGYNRDKRRLVWEECEE